MSARASPACLSPARAWRRTHSRLTRCMPFPLSAMHSQYAPSGIAWKRVPRRRFASLSASACERTTHAARATRRAEAPIRARAARTQWCRRCRKRRRRCRHHRRPLWRCRSLLLQARAVPPGPTCLQVRVGLRAQRDSHVRGAFQRVAVEAAVVHDVAKRRGDKSCASRRPTWTARGARGCQTSPPSRRAGWHAAAHAASARAPRSVRAGEEERASAS